MKLFKVFNRELQHTGRDYNPDIWKYLTYEGDNNQPDLFVDTEYSGKVTFDLKVFNRDKIDVDVNAHGADYLIAIFPHKRKLEIFERGNNSNYFECPAILTLVMFGETKEEMEEEFFGLTDGKSQGKERSYIDFESIYFTQTPFS